MIWEGRYAVQVTSGIFAIPLGAGKYPLPTVSSLDKQLWVGISVDGSDELRPLTQLTSSPYALNVADKSITKEKLSDELLTVLAQSTNGQNSQSANGAGINTANTCNTNEDGRNGTNQVSGGCGNTIFSTIVFGTTFRPIDFSTISGGEGNTITNQLTGGINPNSEGTNWHTIGGGRNNQILIDINAATEDPWMGGSTIGGGEGNILSSPWGLIGAGLNNFIGNQNPVVDDDGGVLMQTNVIGGGNSNTILTASTSSFIGGGQSNTISGAGISPSPGQFIVTAFANHNTIGGGVDNTISNVVDAFIGGGNDNTINTLANGGTISGGWANTASGNVSTISGGDHNTATGEGSSIGGGSANTTLGQYSSIAGGVNNQAGRFTFIGGGFQNNTSLGIIDNSATLGGSELITSGKNQVVLGWRNLPLGNNHLLTNGPNNDRIFEIGSARFQGMNWVRNNAFEVSYNGHSIVTHTNGISIPTGNPPVFQGATYVESPVYAWGAIAANGTPIGTANFGIARVIPLWPAFTMTPGTYLVTLAPADPHGGPVPDITQASVTVTVLNNKTSDFVSAPTAEPNEENPEKQMYSEPEAIPDSVVRALYGEPTMERKAYSEFLSLLQTPTPIDPNAQYCGYATASQIGITIQGVTYPRSFIVRTYRAMGGEDQCYQQERAFFFKVCHR
jgi:hypothetical protein